MGKLSHLTALSVSVLSWFVFVSVLITIFDRLGAPASDDAPITRLKINLEEHRFEEEVVEGRSTGIADLCFVLGFVLSRVVYKLINRRIPISRKEIRWLIYISAGFSIWAFSGELLLASPELAPGVLMVWVMGGEWVNTPLDPRVTTYVVRKLMHFAIGAGIIGLCRWDYMRTFRPN